MAGGFFTLKIDGPDGTVARAQVRTNLRHVHDAWMPEVWRVMGEATRRIWLARQFDQEGGYLGSRWAALSEEYIAWKLAHGYPATIGRRTGALISALTGAPAQFVLFSNHGTTIEAKGILEYDDTHVTVGADTVEDGEPYAEHFDMLRRIFGEGQIPSDMEAEAGKLLSLPLLQAARTDEFGDPEIDMKHFPGEAMMQLISDFRLKDLPT